MRVLFAALAFSALLLTGCDSTDPVSSANPGEVAGTYDIAEFRFVPDRSGIVPADVLDSLAAEESYLDLRATGNFQLIYRFEADDFSDNARGTFTVTRDGVRLTTRDVDVPRMRALLLDRNVALDRESETVLMIDEQMTVDLAAYDADVYGGIEPQPGRLVVRFVLRTDAE